MARSIAKPDAIQKSDTFRVVNKEAIPRDSITKALQALEKKQQPAPRRQDQKR